MRAVRRVAHQHHRRATVVVHPAPADHTRESDPLRRAAQVAGVGHQRVAVELAGEQPLAERDRGVLVHRVQPERAPHRFGRLHDEGRGAVVEAVGMSLHPALFGLFEGEGEGLEQLARTQPDEATQARVDVGPVGGGILAADAAVQAITGDDQVGIGVLLVTADIGLEDQLDAQVFAAPLQDVEQPLAPDATKAMAAGAHLVAADMNLDVVPVVEGIEDVSAGHRVGRTQVAQRLVGKDHAPAEGVVGPVAFDDADVVRRVLQLHQQGEVQAGRATTDADDLHEASCLVVRGGALAC